MAAKFNVYTGEPAGEPEHGARQREPERGDGLQRLRRGQHVQIAEGRARTRVQEVQRHLVRIQLGQVRGEFGALLEGFTHAEDAAAADFHAGFAHHPQGVPAFLPRMGGDDIGEERSGGLQVVVVPVHAHRGELLDLLLGEHAQRACDLNVDLVADRLDARGDLCHQPLVGSAHRSDDAEFGGAGLRGLFGGLDQARDVEPGTAYGRCEKP